eukprot:121504_1
MGNEQSNKLPKYQEGDRILTNDNNKGYIKKICTRNNEDGSVEFGYGVAMDNKVPHGHDGQGDFKCKPGHGVIVAEDFIKLKLDVEQSRPHSHNTHNRKNNSNNCNNNNNWTKKQEQKQIDINIQQKVFVNTQELLDQTQQQLNFIKEYLQCLVNNKSTAKHISNQKQKVKIGLRLYHMNVSSMYDAQNDNKYENYENAFKEAQVLLHKFEQSLNDEQSINNDSKTQLFERLNPLLNYMYVSLQGIDDDKMPELPVIMNYKFDEKIVSRVMNRYVQAANHIIPERRNEIKTNANTYKNQQNQLLQESKNIKPKKTQQINVADITCDIQGPLGHTPSAKQVRQQFKEDKKKYQHQAPDLINGC